MTVKSKKIFLPYTVIAIMVFLMTDSADIIDTVKKTLSLCFSSVIPSLFPFMVLSGVLIAASEENTFRLFEPVTKAFFGMKSACITPIVCGLICGFPIGAKCSAELYTQGKISKSEAETLMAFANNPSPMFVLGTVGIGMFHSLKTGLILYAVQLFSSLSASLVLRLFTTHNLCIKNTFSKSRVSFSSCVCDSVAGTLSICGFVVFFSVIMHLISPLCNIMPSTAAAVINCMTEITNGIYYVCQNGFNTAAKATLASFALGWSGFSVHMQVKSLIKNTNLSMKKYYITKVAMGAFSSLLTFCLFSFYDSVSLFILNNKVFMFLSIFLMVLLIMTAILKYQQKKESTFSS